MRPSQLAILPYVLPIFVFVALSTLETQLPQSDYPTVFSLKIVVVAALTALLIRRGKFPELQFESRYLPLAAALGVVLCAAWIVIDRFTPHFRFLGSRTGYDPWLYLHTNASLFGFLLVRFAGLVILTPIIEELFYRSFLLRFAIDPGNFQSVPLGKYDLASCVFAVIVMSLGHPEWLAAAIFSLAMNIVIYRTKSLFDCIATHAATNFALGVYVIYAHAWQYW